MGFSIGGLQKIERSEYPVMMPTTMKNGWQQK
jgi:hypothetical protein